MLPPAPASVIDRLGRPAFGAYAGRVPRVHWHRGTARTKRWHFASIAGADCVIGLAVVDIGWATSAFAYLFDRRDRRMRCELSRMGAPLLCAHVSERPEEGARTEFGVPGLWVRIERHDDWRIRARGDGFRLEATLAPGPPLCAIVPIEGGVANCTHKSVCLAVRGTAEAGGRRYDLEGSWGALDHTLGILARETTWRWASFSSARVGLNLVEGFNGPRENAVWLDGEIVAAGKAEFEFGEPLSPWRIRARDVDLVFEPEGLRREDKDFGIAKSRFVQAIGSFRGRVAGRDVRGIPGVTEDHEARW